MKSGKRSAETMLAVRALRTRQADGVDVYAFFLAGADLLRIAEISRVHRNAEGALQGFQRKEIRSHVQAIVEFLDNGPVLFPNSIILAISSQAEFTQARGSKPAGDVKVSEAGTLRIPVPRSGSKVAWIVDGQQRSIALSRTRDRSFPVPVVAFVSEDLAVHREQFILVNKARPLNPGMGHRAAGRRGAARRRQHCRLSVDGSAHAAGGHRRMGRSEARFDRHAGRAGGRGVAQGSLNRASRVSSSAV
ncbi:DGQHR domain-containing protein [Leptolyngbya sp. 15MV]|nr:DGQHR domain-containing protein [Leptolyngbya sp. 15MV]